PDPVLDADVRADRDRHADGPLSPHAPRAGEPVEDRAMRPRVAGAAGAAALFVAFLIALPVHAAAPAPTPAPAAAAPGSSGASAADWWKQARTLKDEGRLDEALRTVRLARAAYPTDADLLWFQADVDALLGHGAEAAALYDSLGALHPEL